MLNMLVLVLLFTWLLVLSTLLLRFLSVRCKDNNSNHAQESLRCAKFKFPRRQKIIVSRKWGFTKYKRTDYVKYKSENRIVSDGFNAKVRIILEGLDKFKNLVCLVYYDDNGEVKNLALELVKNARRDANDEPFAWESREYLRKLCIGKEVIFKSDTIGQTGKEFGTVIINGNNYVSKLVVSQGWAKVKEQKGEATPNLAELLQLEEQTKQQGLGKWHKVPSASEAFVRNLPSAFGETGS